MLNDYGYIDAAVANIRKVADEQGENIKVAAALMAIRRMRRAATRRTPPISRSTVLS